MSLEDHTRKQVQMSAVAGHLTKRFAKNVPPEFGGTFEYVKVFFAVFKKQPVTIEEFFQGGFHRYVNNNGFHIPSHQWSLMRFMKRHNALCITAIRYLKRSLCCLIFRVPFFSCTIQKLQQLVNDASQDSKEVNFCAGNLSCIAIDDFKSKHSCNKYCDMMSLKVFGENDI